MSTKGQKRLKRERPSPVMKTCGYCEEGFDLNSIHLDEQWCLFVEGDKDQRYFCSQKCYCNLMDETSNCDDCGYTYWTEDVMVCYEGGICCSSCAPKCSYCERAFLEGDDGPCVFNGVSLCSICSDKALENWRESYYTSKMCLYRLCRTKKEEPDRDAFSYAPSYILHHNIVPQIMSYLANFNPMEWLD